MILPGKCSFGFSCGFSSDSRDVALKLDWDFTRFLLILYVKNVKSWARAGIFLVNAGELFCQSYC